MTRRLGFNRVGGGGGAVGTVTSVNGVLPDGGGNVALGAGDIPYAPTYADALTTGNTSTTVGAQLLWNETHTGTMSWVWNEATLEHGFPVGGGTTHIVDRPAYMLTPLGGAPIGLTVGDDVEVAHPGSIDSSGVQKVLLTGDVPGPLLKGEVVASGLGLLNTSVDPAGKDMQVESLAGRAVTQSDMASIGKGGVAVENVFGPASFRFNIMSPSVASATGMTFDGTLGAILLSSGFAQAPPGGGYVAIDVLSTAVVASQFVVSGYGSVTLDPTDSFTRLDPAGTYPGGPPFPTTGIGTQFFHVTNIGLGEMFGPGIGPDDARIFSLSHQSGPRSNWIGDGFYESIGTPPDAPLDHTGLPDVPLVIPYNNAGGGGTGGTFREMAPAAAQERHSLILGTADAVSINAGGTYTGDGTFPATQALTSGTGSGAEFTVTVSGGAVVSVDSIDKYGAGGYAVGDTITLTVIGPTQTTAAVLDVDEVAWLIRNNGPVANLTGRLDWRTDFERGSGGTGGLVFGYVERRVGGVGPWVEVPGTRSVPRPLTAAPDTATGSAELKNQASGDEYRTVWSNNLGGPAITNFTVTELVIVGQP